jgi:Protein of unknown function (DUF3108)
MKPFFAILFALPVLAGGARDHPGAQAAAAASNTTQRPAPPAVPPPPPQAKAVGGHTAPPGSEALSYVISWPTGLSLGDAHLTTHFAGGRWDTEFSFEASLPALTYTDTASSVATPDFCSLRLNKKYLHGHRTSDETTVFDQEAQTAKRGTGPGQSEMQTAACAKDALAFLDYLRRQLNEGRLPPHQTVYYGAPYQVSVQYKNTEKVTLGSASVDTDHLLATIKGPAVNITCDLYFSQDPARKLLLVKVPLSLATFSMQLEQ